MIYISHFLALPQYPQKKWNLVILLKITFLRKMTSIYPVYFTLIYVKFLPL